MKTIAILLGLTLAAGCGKSEHVNVEAPSVHVHYVRARTQSSGTTVTTTTNVYSGDVAWSNGMTVGDALLVIPGFACNPPMKGFHVVRGTNRISRFLEDVGQVALQPGDRIEPW